MDINTRKAYMTIQYSRHLMDAAHRNWQSLPSSPATDINAVLQDLSSLATVPHLSIESLTNIGRDLVNVTKQVIAAKFSQPYSTSSWMQLMIGFHVWMTLYNNLDIPVVDVITGHFIHQTFYPTLEALINAEFPDQNIQL